MSKFRVGITGYTGFIGSHLVERLSRESDISVMPFDDALFKNPEQFKELAKKCDCIVHLAGMNRGDETEVYSTNVALAQTLATCLEKTGVKPHVIFSSSIWFSTQTAFGRSKKEACRILGEWASQEGASLSLLTIPNVFGDGCKPFYNSAIATFCYQLTHGEQPKVLQDREVEFIYINELIDIIYNAIRKPPSGVDKVRVLGTKKITISALLSILENFGDHFFTKKVVPPLPEPFCVNLYNVFLSYLDYKDLSYLPKVHSDQRGELFEVIKLAQGGQIFFSTTKPGVIRGNHYHTRKIERFCVLKGVATIRLRRIGSDEIKEYRINSSQPTFIEIPIFHTHHIENTGKEELATLFWCNELFDPDDSDTFYEEVCKS